MESLLQQDLKLFYFINHGLSNPFFDIVCPVLRSKLFLAACYLIFIYTSYKKFPGHFFKIAAFGVCTFLLTDQVSAHIIKQIFQRVRPCNNHQIMARLVIEHCGSGFSFVSAHAANSFGIAAFLALVFRNRTAVLILTVWAILVAFAQVYVGVHYPGDVIAGGILGITTGLITGVILKTNFDIRSLSA